MNPANNFAATSFTDVNTWPINGHSERQAPKLRVIERKGLPESLGLPDSSPMQALRPDHPQGKVSNRVQWRDTVVLTRNGAFLMAVAIGPDGMAWSYRQPDAMHSEPVMDSLFPEFSTPSTPVPLQPRVSLRCTHLCAQTIAVGFDSEDRPVVFGAQGLDLEYVVCTDVDDMRWSAPKAAHLDLPAKAVHIERIYTRRMGRHLHVGAMAAVPQDDGSLLYNASYTNWDVRGPDFRHTPVFVESLLNVRPEHVLQSAAQSIMVH